MNRITSQQVEHYREHGYAIVENFLTPEELARSQEELEVLLPGWVGYAYDPTGAKPADWDQPPRSRRDCRFAFKGTQLNANTLHPELREFAATMTGHDNLFCEQSDLTYKCTGHYADTEQHMHMDYMNHTLVYPPSDPAYWQTAYILYYSDVDETQAPTAVCSYQRYKDEVHWPAVYSPEDRPGLYDNEVKVTVPAGSLFAYSMRTFHRGTAFTAEAARVGHFITYAPMDWKWLGIVGLAGTGDSTRVSNLGRVSNSGRAAVTGVSNTGSSLLDRRNPRWSPRPVSRDGPRTLSLTNPVRLNKLVGQLPQCKIFRQSS